MKTTSIAIIILACLPAMALAQSKAATSKARAGIDEGNKTFMALAEKGDAKAIAALYTADAKIMPPGQDVCSGSKEIEAFFAGAMNVIKKVNFETVEVLGAGADSATEVGKYTLYDGTGKAIDNGKYIVVWKRDGKTWKLHRDIFNTSVKAELPTPPTAPKTK